MLGVTWGNEEELRWLDPKDVSKELRAWPVLWFGESIAGVKLMVNMTSYSKRLWLSRLLCDKRIDRRQWGDWAIIAVIQADWSPDKQHRQQVVTNELEQAHRQTSMRQKSNVRRGHPSIFGRGFLLLRFSPDIGLGCVTVCYTWYCDIHPRSILSNITPGD